MTEVIIYATAHASQEREILRAACEWVRRIHDNPNIWGDDQDAALISAVTTAYPNLPCRWETDG